MTHVGCVEMTYVSYFAVLKSCVNKMQYVIGWYKQLECYQRLKDAYYLQVSIDYLNG